MHKFVVIFYFLSSRKEIKNKNNSCLQITTYIRCDEKRKDKTRACFEVIKRDYRTKNHSEREFIIYTDKLL